MRTKNGRVFDAVTERLSDFIDKLPQSFKGKVVIEIPILRGIAGSHTFTVSERGEDIS